MATADEYAGWIVQNQDKKGKPEFDTVAKAYQEAKGAPEAPAVKQGPATAKEEPSIYNKLGSAAVKGFATGGPIMALMNVSGEALSNANDAIAKGAYKAGMGVTDIGSKVGLPPEAAAGLGFATNVGLQAIPALAGGAYAGAKVAPQLEAKAANLMQSALKPTLGSLKSGEAATAIQTMLDEGLNVTPGGVMKLKQKIYGLNNEIKDAIVNSPASINKNTVYGPIKETLDKFSKQVNPNGDIAAIKGAWEEFINHPLIKGDEIPVQLAQELKQGTYRVLAKKYGQVGAAETEAQKSIARGLKDQIAEAVPGVSALNAQESKLIETLHVAERRVLMDANKNPMGLATLAHNPTTWALFMADRSPLFKSLAARMVNAGSERVPQAIASGGLAGVISTGNKGQP